jgi:small subunit ribosomal protein S20
VADRHASTIKRHKQSLVRAERNRALRTRLRHAIRSLRETIAAADGAKAQEQLVSVTRTIDKAATKGIIHRNNASRRISRLASQVHALTQQG